MKLHTNPNLLDKVKRKTEVEPSGTNVVMCIAFVFIFLIPTINAIIKLNF